MSHRKSSGHAWLEGSSDWLEEAPQQYRETLRQFGIVPGSHPRAAEYNERLLEAARRSFEGEELVKEAARLHVEIFRGDAAGIAQVLNALAAANRVDEIGHVGYVMIKLDGSTSYAGAGRFDPRFVMQAVESATDVLEGLAEPSEFTRVVAEPPQRKDMGEAYRYRLRREIDKALHGLSERNDGGEIEGLALVACGPQGAACHIRGAVPPRPVARSLRKLCNDIERESRAGRPRADRLPAWFLGEEE